MMDVVRARANAADKVRGRAKVMAAVRVTVGAARAVAGVRDAVRAGVTQRRVDAVSKVVSFARVVASAGAVVPVAAGARDVAKVAAEIFKAIAADRASRGRGRRRTRLTIIRALRW
jgi:hypothetical protein